MKGNEELKDQVQNILYDMLNDGTLEKIADKWGLSDNLISDKPQTRQLRLIMRRLRLIFGA